MRRQSLKLCFLLLLISSFLNVTSQDKGITRDDKIRIREAINLSPAGNKLWDNFHSVPFVILLITDSSEYLMNHPNPSTDFVLSGTDEVLRTKVFFRKKVFNPHFLATFPAVNGVPTIVVGTPANTNKASTEWIITLLHEHFHQYQMTFPKYHENVNSLDLSGGDQTGMWMLNYPFPYDSIPVMEQYNQLTKALALALNAPQKNFPLQLKNYITERRKFKALLSPADYRYLTFQLWQEGIARYTEYKFLELLQDKLLSKEVARIKDHTTFKDGKLKLYKNEMNNILTMKLDEGKRICFYSLGFGEGLLLDRINKNWRKNYLGDIFFMEKYLQ